MPALVFGRLASRARAFCGRLPEHEDRAGKLAELVLRLVPGTASSSSHPRCALSRPAAHRRAAHDTRDEIDFAVARMASMIASWRATWLANDRKFAWWALRSFNTLTASACPLSDAICCARRRKSSEKCHRLIVPRRNGLLREPFSSASSLSSRFFRSSCRSGFHSPSAQHQAPRLPDLGSHLGAQARARHERADDLAAGRAERAHGDMNAASREAGEIVSALWRLPRSAAAKAWLL